MPVRTRKYSHGRNIIGYFPSLKMGRMMFFESLIELDCIRLLDFEQTISEFHEQPFTIHYEYQKKHYQYTPDFAVTRDGQRYLVECKPYARIGDEENQRKFKAASQWCEANGWVFCVATDQSIRSGYRLKNVEHLTYYARHEVDAVSQSRIYSTLLSTNGPLQIAELMEAVSPHKPQAAIMPILHLTYHHQLFIPLNDALITRESVVFLAGQAPASLLLKESTIP